LGSVVSSAPGKSRHGPLSLLFDLIAESRRVGSVRVVIGDMESFGRLATRRQRLASCLAAFPVTIISWINDD